VEAGGLDGQSVEATVATELAPLLGGRGDSSEFVFSLPPGATIDTLLLGCTHYPLLRPVIERLVGADVAIVDSATATASAVVEMLAMNGLEAPVGNDATHVQLTTGDVAAFTTVARRLFGEAFLDVTSLEVGTAVA
jgi:glutamate racemase